MNPTDPKPTCGPLYKAALQQYAGDDEEKIRLFAAGFIVGQAEKCYLGACLAVMFRPSAERRVMVLSLATDAAQRYALSVVELDDEVWIANSDYRLLVQDLHKLTRNSAAWHYMRGRLTGVPEAEIDPQFHLRPGAGERCD